MTFVQLLLRLGDLRYTSWIRDFTYETETYTAAGALQSLRLPDHTLELSKQNMSFQLSLTAEEVRPQIEGLGPVESEALVLYSNDNAGTWLGPAYQFDGLLSRSSVNEGVWSASIDRDFGNKLERFAEITHERQLALYPGDLGMQAMAALAQGQQVDWP